MLAFHVEKNVPDLFTSLKIHNLFVYANDWFVVIYQKAKRTCHCQTILAVDTASELVWDKKAACHGCQKFCYLKVKEITSK